MGVIYARACVCVCVCVCVVYAYIVSVYVCMCLCMYDQIWGGSNAHIHTKYHACIHTTYCDLQNNCKFDRPLKNAWMRGIPIQCHFFTQLRERNSKKGPKSFRNGLSNLQLFCKSQYHRFRIMPTNKSRHVYICICTCTHMLTLMHIRSCAHFYIQVHTHIDLHAYTCLHS